MNVLNLLTFTMVDDQVEKKTIKNARVSITHQSYRPLIGKVFRCKSCSLHRAWIFRAFVNLINTSSSFFSSSSPPLNLLCSLMPSSKATANEVEKPKLQVSRNKQHE